MIRSLLIFKILICQLAMTVNAHVPFLECEDYSLESPFVVEKDPAISIAIYGYLESSNDTDVVELEFDNSDERLFVQVIIPACEPLEDFLPYFAITGPGVANATSTTTETRSANLPEEISENIDQDEKVVIMEHLQDDRECNYEPFGNKSYLRGAEYDELVTEAGKYKVVVWDPEGMTGDYVLVIGYLEDFHDTGLDPLISTFKIRNDMELHIDDCKTSCN